MNRNVTLRVSGKKGSKIVDYEFPRRQLNAKCDLKFKIHFLSATFTHFHFVSLTHRCTKLVDGQIFGPGIAHLRIENAGEIRLGPNALRARNLQQLESIAIVDTRIVEMDRTAFNGITYLFAVNLTRNGLQDIHPNIFQNNTQLGLLTIAGNPLKHIQDSKQARQYLLHAPSVTDFDFSNNGLVRLKRVAFSKMHSLGFINLHGNNLKELDPSLFDSLESLTEIDVSDNSLSKLPLDLFLGKGVQILRISGKNGIPRDRVSNWVSNKSAKRFATGK